jgi:hypothetical protein
MTFDGTWESLGVADIALVSPLAFSFAPFFLLFFSLFDSRGLLVSKAHNGGASHLKKLGRRNLQEQFQTCCCIWPVIKLLVL